MLFGVIASSRPKNVALTYLLAGNFDYYLWNNGFSTRTNFSSQSSSASVATGAGFDPSGQNLVMWSAFYRLQGWQFSNGLGTKYTNSSAIYATSPTRTLAWHPSGNAVAALADGGTPRIGVWPFTSGVGFGTVYADPSPAITTNSRDISFSPNGNTILYAPSSAPGLSAHSWSSGWGTMYTSPGDVPGGGRGVSWHPSGNVVVAATSLSPGVVAYPWSSGFGTKYANPSISTSTTNTKIAFSPSGNNVAISASGSPYVHAYSWSSGWGTKYANPATLPSTGAQSVIWTSDGNSVIIGTTNLDAYQWSGGFGTKYSNPASPPGSSTLQMSFNK